MPFCIPTRDDDLLEVSDANYYVSDLVIDFKAIDKAQKKFHKYVNGGEFEQITEYFDMFFSVARHNEDISNELRIRIFEVLAIGLSNLTGSLRSHVCEVMNAEVLTNELNELNAKFADCLLMYIYLLSRISHHLETYTVKKIKNLIQKINAKKVQNTNDLIVDFWSSCDGRLHLLRLFYGLVTIDALSDKGNPVRGGIKFLWTPNIINDQLIRCIIKTIMKIIENPEASKNTGRTILVPAFYVLRSLCVKWDQNKAIAKSLMELAPRLEFFQQQSVTHFPMIDALLTVQVNDELEPLIASMLAYIGNFDHTSLMAKGEVTARVFSLFISSLSEKYPKVLFKNVAHIVPYLSFDPPSLRNSVLTAFTEIVIRCFNESNLLTFNSNNLLKQKLTMLFRLQDHIMDSSALVRTKALNSWTKLAIKNAIPIELFRLLLIRLIGERLNDNSIMVRKAAVTLLTTILSHNIFSSNLNFSDILIELNLLRKKSAELRETNPEFDIIRDVNKEVDLIDESIKEIIKLSLEEYVLSDNLPTMESVSRRSISLNNQLNNETESQFISRTQEVVDSYYIATMILNSKTRIEGCLEYLKLAIRQNKDDFARDMDIDEMVNNLSNSIRELILQQGVAYNIRDDDQVLIEEDRIDLFWKKVTDIENLIQRTMDKLYFIKEIEKCIAKATYCVKFGQLSEMQEMIRFICECCKFNIKGAKNELKKIFHLIWRKDNNIIHIIVDAGYDALFSKNSDIQVSSRRTAINLFDLMSDATEEERVSFEETLIKIITIKGLTDEILNIFWQSAEQHENFQQKLIAIRLLAAVAKAQKHRIRPELGRLTQLYRTRNEIVRVEVLRVIVALTTNSENESKDFVLKTTFRIPSSDKLIKSMFAFIITELSSEQHKLWIPHCREVVNVIYGISCRPYAIISSFFSRIVRSSKRSLHQHNILVTELKNSLLRFDELKDINKSQLDNNLISEKKMLKIRIKYLFRLISRSKPRWELSAARLLYFVGEIALKFLTYLEVVFTKEIKYALQLIHEIRLMDNITEEFESSLKFVEFDINKDMPLNQFEKDCIRQRGFFERADREDDRIGLTAISEEEKLQLKLQKILDKDSFNSSTINGRILPFVILILKSYKIVSVPLIESAIGCLAKLMLINRKCCQKLLPIFFNFYEIGSVQLRNNMIIMMTDLCFRFPNVFNKYNDEYIKKIYDKNSGIRYTCLLVLSHMLLNDLIKVSGRIADLAPCLCDEDKQILLLARGFFTEISKKNNVLYNTMPDIISKLTTNRQLTTKKFEEVMKFLLQFITKDQHKESLIEKICQRFQLLKTHQAGGNALLPEALAFCIAQISLNARCFRRLTDNVRLYQEFLRLPQVYKHFSTAIASFKKASLKSLELKAQIEEFEQSLEQYQKNEE